MRADLELRVCSFRPPAAFSLAMAEDLDDDMLELKGEAAKVTTIVKGKFDAFTDKAAQHITGAAAAVRKSFTKESSQAATSVTDVLHQGAAFFASKETIRQRFAQDVLLLIRKYKILPEGQPSMTGDFEGKEAAMADFMAILESGAKCLQDAGIPLEKGTTLMDESLLRSPRRDGDMSGRITRSRQSTPAPAAAASAASPKKRKADQSAPAAGDQKPKRPKWRDTL